MAVEKWAEDGRLAIICDRCGVRVRTQAMTMIGAGRVLSGAGWKQGIQNARALVCVACTPPPTPPVREPLERRPRRKHGTRSAATSPQMQGTIVAAEKGQYTLSFVDRAGRKRFLVWTPPAHQRTEAVRALITSEEVTVHAEGHVRVIFQEADTPVPALRNGRPTSSGNR